VGLKRLFGGAALAGCLALVSGVACADDIPVYNNLFEISNPMQYTCAAPATCAWNGGPIPGWTSNAPLNASGSQQPGNTMYIGSLPGGSTTMAWVNSGTLTQTLDVSLLPDSTYTLLVYIGHRLPDPTPLFPGDPQANLIADYSISLDAGNTTLATLTGSNGDITAGTFALETLTYTTGSVVTPGDLSIVLGSDGAQIDFDDVQLDPEPTPEPASFVLTGIGVACLALLWRHSQA
jgi:hypothetical protein